MKILIIGSMAFAKDMISLQKELQQLGYDASIPHDTLPHLSNDQLVDSLEENLKMCIQNNTMKNNFDLVAQQDAVLVLNKKRNGLEGYIGTSALLEMGIAHYLGKKIFLYQTPPHYNDVRWAHEVAIMQPVILNGDLKKIV